MTVSEIVHSAVLHGLTSQPMDIEITRGGDRLIIEGDIGKNAARETFIRVTTAFELSDLKPPRGRVVFKALHPLPANGLAGVSSCDLAVVMGLRGQARPGTLVVGCVGVDGRVEAVRGIVSHLKQTQYAQIVMPTQNVIGMHAVQMPPRRIFCCSHINVSLAEYRHENPGEPAAATLKPHWQLFLQPDRNAFKAAVSRETQKRSHTADQQVLEIWSASGLTAHFPPLRVPHFSISKTALVGAAGDWHIPEVTLAHHGTLVLDDLDAFPPRTVEALAHALKTGTSANGLPAKPYRVLAWARKANAASHPLIALKTFEIIDR